MIQEARSQNASSLVLLSMKGSDPPVPPPPLPCCEEAQLAHMGKPHGEAPRPHEEEGCLPSPQLPQLQAVPAPSTMGLQLNESLGARTAQPSLSRTLHPKKP